MRRTWLVPTLIVAGGSIAALLLGLASAFLHGLANEGLDVATPLFAKGEFVCAAIGALAAVSMRFRLRLGGLAALVAAILGYVSVLVDDDVYNRTLELVLWTVPALILACGGLVAVAHGGHRNERLDVTA